MREAGDRDWPASWWEGDHRGDTSLNLMHSHKTAFLDLTLPLFPPSNLCSHQLMHSQNTDFLSSSLAVEPALQLMFAARCAYV